MASVHPLQLPQRRYFQVEVLRWQVIWHHSHLSTFPRIPCYKPEPLFYVHSSKWKENFQMQSNRHIWVIPSSFPDTLFLWGQRAVAAVAQGLLSTVPGPMSSHSPFILGLPENALHLPRHLKRSKNLKEASGIPDLQPGSTQTVRKHGQASVYWPCN